MRSSYMHMILDIGDEFPLDVYMELDDDRWQTKVIEFFRSGRIAYAYDVIENGTFLAEDKFPEPEEINGVDGYEGVFLEYISTEDLYSFWNRYVTEQNK